MWRLRVGITQLNKCVEKSIFALYARPNMDPGDLLLLQLNQGDAKKSGKLHSRVEYVIVFDRREEDIDGSIIRAHWQNAPHKWNWMIYGSETKKTKPFSLEDLLHISKSYEERNTAIYINKEDKDIIKPYIYY
jgi:hypothetical protein